MKLNHSVPKSIWNNIESSLEQQKNNTSTIPKKLVLGACIASIFLISITIYNVQQNRNTAQINDYLIELRQDMYPTIQTNTLGIY